MTVTNVSPSSRTPSKPSMPRWQLAVLGAFGVFFFAFGLLTLETAASIWRGVSYLTLTVLSVVVSPDFAWGGENGYAGLPQILSQYYAKSGRMVLHTAMGGIVVGIGITQFVPGLRRKHSTLHRRLGMVVASAMALSMAGALTYLASSRLDSIFSGPTFFVFLWGLALLALFALAQAALAILSRDFRSHMVWMAICFSTFLTAPFLRLDWVLLGLSMPMSLQRANAAIAPLVLVQTLLLMQLWLSFIGDGDLPARMPAPATALPRSVLRTLAALTTLIALHEGLLAPLGWGLLSSQRDALTLLPLVGAVWAVATAVAASGSVNAWDDWMRGQRPSKVFLVATGLHGLSMVVVGSQVATRTLDGLTWSFLWQSLGVVELLVLVASLKIAPNSLGRNSWGLLGLSLLWTVAMVPLCAFLLARFGLSQSESVIAATTLVLGTMLCAAVGLGMGARLRALPQ